MPRVHSGVDQRDPDLRRVVRPELEQPVPAERVPLPLLDRLTCIAAVATEVRRAGGAGHIGGDHVRLLPELGRSRRRVGAAHQHGLGDQAVAAQPDHREPGVPGAGRHGPRQLRAGRVRPGRLEQLVIDRQVRSLGSGDGSIAEDPQQGGGSHQDDHHGERDQPDQPATS